MNDDNTYVIKKGDTFWDLENEWGMPHGTLQDLNPNLKPRELPVGGEMKIKMPTLVYLIAEEIPESIYQDNIYREFYETKIDNLRVANDFGVDKMIPEFGVCEPVQNDFEEESNLQTLVKTTTIGGKILSLENIKRTNKLTSNELWHLQKNGTVSHPWKKMKNGASHWKNNLIQNHRVTAQAASKAKAIRGLSKLGSGLVLADVALSGEVKPSHMISVALIGASSTGVGAIFAGIYFVADIGTGLVTGSSISDRIDGWAADNVGTFEIYEGYY